jgi:hypothetical protein
MRHAKRTRRDCPLLVDMRSSKRTRRHQPSSRERVSLLKLRFDCNGTTRNGLLRTWRGAPQCEPCPSSQNWHRRAGSALGGEAPLPSWPSFGCRASRLSELRAICVRLSSSMRVLAQEQLQPTSICQSLSRFKSSKMRGPLSRMKGIGVAANWREMWRDFQ